MPAPSPTPSKLPVSTAIHRKPVPSTTGGTKSIGRASSPLGSEKPVTSQQTKTNIATSSSTNESVLDEQFLPAPLFSKSPEKKQAMGRIDVNVKLSPSIHPLGARPSGEESTSTASTCIEEAGAFFGSISADNLLEVQEALGAEEMDKRQKESKSSTPGQELPDHVQAENEDVERLLFKLDELETRAQSQSKVINSLADKNRALALENGDLQDKVDAQYRTIEMLSNKFTHNANEMTEFQENSEKRDQDWNQREEKYKSTINKLEIKIKDMRRDSEFTENEFRNQADQVETLQSELEERDKWILNLQQRIEELGKGEGGVTLTQRRYNRLIAEQKGESTDFDEEKKDATKKEAITPASVDFCVFRCEMAMKEVMYERALNGFVEGDTSKALSIAEDALRKSEVLAIDNLVAKSLFWLGFVHFFADNVEVAATKFDEANTYKSWRGREQKELAGWINTCAVSRRPDRHPAVYRAGLARSKIAERKKEGDENDGQQE